MTYNCFPVYIRMVNFYWCLDSTPEYHNQFWGLHTPCLHEGQAQRSTMAGVRRASVSKLNSYQTGWFCSLAAISNTNMATNWWFACNLVTEFARTSTVLCLDTPLDRCRYLISTCISPEIFFLYYIIFRDLKWMPQFHCIKIAFGNALVFDLQLVGLTVYVIWLKYHGKVN